MDIYRVVKEMRQDYLKVAYEWTIDDLYDALEYLDIQSQVDTIIHEDLERQNQMNESSNTGTEIKIKV